MMISIRCIRLRVILVFGVVASISAQNVVNQRPQYHVMPQNNWVNDPNGPMFWNGQYHLFFQCNPDAATWGDMHWGHAVSADLVTWRHLPYALSPDQPYDVGGVYTGSVTIGPNGPMIIYTGGSADDNQTTNIAYPQDPTDPELVSWIKYSGNPVMSEPTTIKTHHGFRDPTTAWQTPDGQWHLLTGAGLVDDNGGWHGAVLAFESSDLVHWTYDGVFQEEPSSSRMGFWECPDFFQLGDVHVLKYSEGPGTETFPWASDHYLIGKYTWENGTFQASSSGIVDYGQYYASKSFNDSATGRQIIWGWVTENDPTDNWVSRGWSGMQSLPRLLTIGADGALHTPPIAEIDQLRLESWQFSGVMVNDTSLLLGVKGDVLEIDFNFTDVGATVVSLGINVRVSPTVNETTSIVILPPDNTAAKGTGACAPYQLSDKTNSTVPCVNLAKLPVATVDECCQQCTAHRGCGAWSFADGVCYLNKLGGPCAAQAAASGQLRGSIGIDRSRSSIADPVNTADPVGPLPSGNDVRVYLDRSVVEIYANQGGTVVTSRIYPSSPDSLGIEVYAIGGAVTFDVMVSQMGTIWADE
eukprot:TRINITY_DN7234_c0_g1_i1.p1 TRINITY_DN7234_c0_g1~~TRINITY_DN7234_c0_g1_i1.p1  ORF type:complete len:583 (+),score=182.76 TRINITY_DN7234_c0_g1_i1:51-1799(+)